MNIIGNKIYLRAMELSDMELYREDMNLPETETAVGGWSYPVSSYQQERWFESAAGNGNNQRFTICDKETNRPVGMINLVNIDMKNGVAFSGIRLFGDENKGKGYGKDAVFAIMEYAFNQLRLNRLEGSILVTNEPSKKLYEKCGWIVEGKKREAVFKNGRFIDELQVAILKSDYEKIRNEV